MKRLTKKYVKVLHKPIITNSKQDIELRIYFVEGNHLYHKGYDYIDEKVEYEDLGEIVAMSDNKEDLIKLQKYTRIERDRYGCCLLDFIPRFIEIDNNVFELFEEMLEEK